MARKIVDVVRLGKRGALVIPRRVRSALGLQEGDELMVKVEENRLVLEHRGRGFGAYLDVMSDLPEDKETGAPVERRRGLARFLVK